MNVRNQVIFTHLNMANGYSQAQHLCRQGEGGRGRRERERRGVVEEGGREERKTKREWEWNSVREQQNSHTQDHVGIRFLTFFIWNRMVALTSSIFCNMLSLWVRREGNFPALLRPGPSSLGICLIKLSDARKASYRLATLLTCVCEGGMGEKEREGERGGGREGINR